ncbi:MAG: peptidylprolyl isomerase [Kiloniellaceae bacterium]|nr:peptidylprolyl isomerase [Kiloniellaceae bacterium]
MKSLFSLIAIGLLAMSIQTNEAGAQSDPENTLVLELKDGSVRIEMLPDLAPAHVERIKTLTRQGFYDGIVFHRVIDGFMAQTGDPTGTGRGGSDLPDLPAEFSAEPFERGVMGMARSQNPNSANSQFFITFASARFLDRQYTVWGRVIEGMEYVDMIKKAPPGDQSGTVRGPDKIISLKVEADVK